MKKNYLFAGIIILLLGFTSCKKGNQPQAGHGPMPFPVKTAEKSDVTTYTEYAANIEGVQNIEIRPKVDGFIDEIYIDEGDQVTKGQLLFKLSAETLSQQVKAAKANIKVAEAQVFSAQVEVDKITPLVEKNIISSIQLKTATSNLNAAKAQLAAAEAQYQNTRENLEYTMIKSPVEGIVGSLPYKVGSLVGRTEAKPLTTVSNIKNVHAYFTLNEKQLLQFNRQLNGNTANEKIKKMPEVELVLADGSLYEFKGKIETINGMVNPRTGSISYRAIFPNPNNLLRSGISGKVKMPSDMNDIVLLPQKATYELQGKKFVYLVGKENKVESKEVIIASTVDNHFIVKGGVNPGQQYVVDGLIKLRDGMQIIPQSGQSKADGNVAFSQK
ncbi:efflux RND transporter periplasmic adaptor subunit [Marinifilum sp. D737]|jgi:membrane fusion protein (multidrug efflux system)|uniref:efflux RND transporter periplasmic adaptor subunit n=1 Tax=Marinifilum sp. D737 TaxID=2969628 RepID=UPI0022751BE6|nr:efflux RND transporter periplasmic adaptor subunit [Marinifilum sp. D737]MCY1634128.1 efflux RND transporter periplasmic adaptor subunit [Marinifilum sp. D737]